MRKSLLLLSGLMWSTKALAADTWVYYDPTLMTAGDVATLTNQFVAAGGSVTTTTSSVWPTNYTGYKLVVILMPASAFSAAQANALTTFVNNGGRLVVSGDYGTGTGFQPWNNRVNALMTSMGVPLSLGNSVISGGGCASTATIVADDVTSGMTSAYIAASNNVAGGTALIYYGGSAVAAVAQPNSVGHARTPYDVVLFGDTNLLLGSCAGYSSQTSNAGMWQNIYDGTCGDADGDGYTDDSCGGTDCDDSNRTVFPGAAESCDGLDNDCDGGVDTPVPSNATTWYADSDGDGFGNAASGYASCTRPTGYVGNSADCDDGSNTVYPGAAESCNGIDDDCDGTIDDNPTNLNSWYEDRDGDGWGFGPVTLACTAPTGFVSTNTDCSDRDATIYPGAAEIPYDNIDQDCDGADLQDVDGDGYAGGGGSDCWDSNATVYPGVPEVEDGVDQDCDGAVDEGTTAFDDDGDGYTEQGGDCDDNEALTHPEGTEVVDGADQDCNGIVDDNTIAYDDDGDGSTELQGDCSDGDPSVYPGASDDDLDGVDNNCDGLVDGGLSDPDEDGYAAVAGDCDDFDADAYPGNTEIADGKDNDCDGVVDEGTSVRDDDGDGISEDQGDCNDEDPSVNPNAAERANGRDDNCDGATDENTPISDDDGDGFTEEAGDCDDADATSSPAAPELLDGLDNDCDGQADEGAEDLDEDGVTEADGDCNDQNGWVNPLQAELCDGLDNDCNGVVDNDVCGDSLDTGKGTEPPGSCGCDGTGGAGIATFGLGILGALRRRRKN